MSARTMLMGVVIAGAAGAVLGVLFAPAKGSDTRKRIAEKGAQYAIKGENRLTAYVEAAVDGYDAFDDSTLDWADMGRAQLYSGAGMDRVR